MSYPLSITKEEINQLPPFKFEGEIHLVETEKDALNAAQKLQQENELGFDTETRAAFKKGESYDISLLQLATGSDAYLFRINKFKVPQEIADILENPNIVKAGVAIRDDIKGLQKIFSFSQENFIDLADIAKEKKYKNFGLRALTAIFLKKKLSKKAKISNWNRVDLTPEQVNYAASDAVVGYEIYQRLMK